MTLTIKQHRNRYAIFAGKARLSRTFEFATEAAIELEANRNLYAYWAGSASVSDRP